MKSQMDQTQQTAEGPFHIDGTHPTILKLSILGISNLGLEYQPGALPLQC